MSLVWFVIRDIEIWKTYNHLIVTATSNTIFHLFLTWSYIKPTRKIIWRTVRGSMKPCGWLYSWKNEHLLEQLEPKLSLKHTFSMYPMLPGYTVWFYIHSLPVGRVQQCQTPLMSVTMDYYKAISCRVWAGESPVIPPSVWRNILFTQALWDEGNLWYAPHFDRLNAPFPGIYDIGARVTWTTNPNGFRVLRIIKNGVYQPWGSIVADVRVGVPFTQTEVVVNTHLELKEGDYLEPQVYQSSGIPLPLDCHHNFSPGFWMTRLD